MKKTVLAITFIISLAGCSREYNCTNENLHLSFIGFLKSDIDTLIIKKYAANNNFQQLINTVQFAIDTTGILQTNDTISFGGAAINNMIQYGNDWQIIIPSKNITVTISNIISPQEQGKCSAGGKVNCVLL